MLCGRQRQNSQVSIEMQRESFKSWKGKNVNLVQTRTLSVQSLAMFRCYNVLSKCASVSCSLRIKSFLHQLKTTISEHKNALQNYLHFFLIMDAILQKAHEAEMENQPVSTL